MCYVSDKLPIYCHWGLWHLVQWTFNDIAGQVKCKVCFLVDGINIVCFFRQGSGMYGPDQVDASLCTHIIYAWAHLDPDSGEIVPGNAQLDIENGKE